MHRNKIFYILALVLALPGTVASAHAEPETIRELVSQTGGKKIISAYAVVFDARMMSSEKDIEASRARKIPVVVETGANQAATLSFQFDSGKSRNEKNYTILYTLADRSVHGTPVKLLPGTPAESATAVLAICEPSERANAWPVLGDLTETDLQTLIEIRRKKKTLLLEQAREMLTPAKINELEAIEARFGFSHQEKFSADLPVNQLVWRLGIIDTLQHQP